MDEVGKLLREAREEKGLNLDDISRVTKIQEKYLKALEEDDFSLFSGEIYIRGALRNYARAVDLNADEILSFYSVYKKKYDVEEKNDDHKTKRERKVYFSPKRKKPFPSVAFIWLLLLVFVASCSVWFLYGQGSQKETKKPV